MTPVLEEPQLVGEDWEPSTFEDVGATELGARIEAAEPLLVQRRALEGRCGLEDRELWELGVRIVPAGALSTGGGVLLRLVIVGAIAAMGVCLTIAVALIAKLGSADSALGVPGGVAIILFVVLTAHALFRLAWGAAGRERERRLARRRVPTEAVAPLLDPNGRLTVTVLDGPGVLRVLLLWLRGHPQDADMLEARVVAERRVPRDEPSRAEDAVVALSGVAMLATRVGTDARDVEAGAMAGASGSMPAASAEAASRRVGTRVTEGAAAARATASRVRVGPDWQPDGTTEEGEAELARRLCLAKPRRWSAEVLVPLVVDDVRQVCEAAPPMPTSTERKACAPRPVWITWPAPVATAFLMYFVASSPSAAIGTEVTMRSLFLAAAGWVAWKAFRPQIVELPHRWRRRRLMRRVDDAACDAAARLEAGLPGGHGTVVVVSAEQKGRRVVRLVHLRRVVDAPQGTLDARVLAERRLEPGDDIRETVSRFLIVADDQAFTTQRGRERTEGLRRLSRRLGVISGRGRGRGALLREPLALLAIIAVVLGAVLAILAVIFAFIDGDDALVWLAASALLGTVAAALLACSRRWTSISEG
jgi:hypothetical protein